MSKLLKLVPLLVCALVLVSALLGCGAGGGGGGGGLFASPGAFTFPAGTKTPKKFEIINSSAGTVSATGAVVPINFVLVSGIGCFTMSYSPGQHCSVEVANEASAPKGAFGSLEGKTSSGGPFFVSLTVN